MSTDEDRRDQGTTRIPFDALVEVGGALGPSFEAQAVDISEEGMHLRTAYLPEIGQPLSCRFEAGSQGVLVSGEVVWREERGRGGEFGVCFKDLDAECAAALSRIVGVDRAAPPQDPGTKVRLHIDGLGSPMRARVREASSAELTVGSELGFLQVGKQLELEDAATGSKRPARIDRVDVEIDPDSLVPQLVVTLRYDDVEETADTTPADPTPADAAPAGEQGEAKESTPGPSVIDGEDAPGACVPAAAQAGEELDAIRKASDQMRGAFARGAARIGPAVKTWARRARVTLTLLARRRRRDDSVPIPLKRTTAPPPGGGLHASGRRVVRGEASSDAKESLLGTARTGSMRRKIAAGGAIAAAGVLCMVVLHKSPAPPGAQEGSSAAAGAVAATVAAPTSPESPAAPLLQATPPMPPSTAQTETLRLPGAPPLAAPPAADVEVSSGMVDGADPKHHHVHVAPFGNGPVAHGPLIHLKMDGTIEKLEGAAAPTGFTVRLPDRRSLEPAGPLAQRDARIASIHVSNEASGAELTVAFRDGVPNYQVRAKGDTLEIALAPVGRISDAPPAEARTEHHTEAPTAMSKRHRGKHFERR